MRDEPLFLFHLAESAELLRVGPPRQAPCQSRHPNDLRRAYARWHKRKGVDNAEVSKILRHTTDKLVQTTYGNLDGEEVSTLVNSTLEGVPVLYVGTGPNGINGDLLHDEIVEIQAPPTRIERVTFGLGNEVAISAHGTPQSAEAAFEELCLGMGSATECTNGGGDGQRGKPRYWTRGSVAVSLRKVLTFAEVADRALGGGDVTRARETLGGLRLLLECTLREQGS